MLKAMHEIRDPIHNFIKLNSDERHVLNSRPLQRLRHIHQLALTYLVYPGASHKRFEHSLGVMELATKVYDIITMPVNLSDNIRNHFPDLSNPEFVAYWRKVLRMAALCHDIGHLPFSHAAENKLLKNKMKHEDYTIKILLSDEMKQIFLNMTPPIKPIDVACIAVGKNDAGDLPFDDWKGVLSDIIVDNSLGVDRMDYLLRDSHHIGVAYGKFDHFRLVDCMRLLPFNDDQSLRPAIGIEIGGIHAVEAMILARYYMYKQVYFHHARRVYDLHLTDFLTGWLQAEYKTEHFPDNIDKYLETTDNEINAALLHAYLNQQNGHLHSSRILNRNHFKLVFRAESVNQETDESDIEMLKSEIRSIFSEDLFKVDYYRERGRVRDFPILLGDGQIDSSVDLSELLKNIPTVSIFCVFADDSIRTALIEWIVDNKMLFNSKAKGAIG